MNAPILKEKSHKTHASQLLKYYWNHPSMTRRGPQGWYLNTWCQETNTRHGSKVFSLEKIKFWGELNRLTRKYAVKKLSRDHPDEMRSKLNKSSAFCNSEAGQGVMTLLLLPSSASTSTSTSTLAEVSLSFDSSKATRPPIQTSSEHQYQLKKVHLLNLT